jgi:glyoxylase I family protein
MIMMPASRSAHSDGKAICMQPKLHHVNYSTKDVAATADFYRSVLNLKPVPGRTEQRDRNHGYSNKVEFLTDATTEFHIAEQDLGVAFRTKQSLNPVERGHIAFRVDDIEAFKTMLRHKNIPFADYGRWAMGGWYQIFLQAPDGTVVEVHQADESK